MYCNGLAYVTNYNFCHVVSNRLQYVSTLPSSDYMYTCTHTCIVPCRSRLLACYNWTIMHNACMLLVKLLVSHYDQQALKQQKNKAQTWTFYKPQPGQRTQGHPKIQWMKSSLADLVGSGAGCHTVQVKGHRCCGFQRVSMEPVSHGEKIPEREERC